MPVDMNQPTYSNDQTPAVTQSVCIVGAGPGGLSIARALKKYGIAYDQFERHSDVGGIWDLNNPGTPMYESAHFISSRDLSGYSDFPMPKSFPDYPKNSQVLAYVQTFARAYGLYDAIQFGVGVESLEKLETGQWRVRLSNGDTGTYAAVVCATGNNWDPNIPTIAGEFSGEARHSVTYKRADEFKGKRVLVMGVGNSGADIGCDAARSADAAFISMRRGYHFIPKHIFGVPADEFGESGPQLPIWLIRPVFSGLLKIIRGDVTRWGVPKPDHKLLESHPLLNTQLIHHLQHGDIKVVPDIKKFDGKYVVFKDDTREQIDLVLFATGYKWSMPYATSFFDWKGGRPDMYLAIFNRQHKNIFCLGYVETNSSAFKMFDAQARLIANYLNAQFQQSPSHAQFDQLIASDAPDLSGGLNFVKSQRHDVYLEAHALKNYIAKINKKMGWHAVKPGDYTVPLPTSWELKNSTPLKHDRMAVAS
jgi:Flavin-binding monooxygenase-like